MNDQSQFIATRKRQHVRRVEAQRTRHGRIAHCLVKLQRPSVPHGSIKDAVTIRAEARGVDRATLKCDATVDHGSRRSCVAEAEKAPTASRKNPATIQRSFFRGNAGRGLGATLCLLFAVDTVLSAKARSRTD